MKDKRILYLVQGAMIAAIYAAATYLSSIFGLAYGPVQFRISEALTVLPVLTPAAIPGLTIGCIIANIGSPMGVVDIIFGSIATLLAAVTARMLRKVTVRGIPILSILMPVVFNGIIIGIEIVYLMPSVQASFTAFLINACQVALGELAVCLIGGIPLFLAFRKSRIFANKPKNN